MFAAPDVAALALSGDWTSEFLSSVNADVSSGQPGFDASDAEWTREFINEVSGQVNLVPFYKILCLCV